MKVNKLCHHYINSYLSQLYFIITFQNFTDTKTLLDISFFVYRVDFHPSMKYKLGFYSRTLEDHRITIIITWDYSST